MNARNLQRGFILLPVVLALVLVAAVAFLLNRTGGMSISLAARALQTDSARYAAEAGLAQINSQTQSRNCSGYTDLPAAAFGAASFSATVNPKSGTPVTLASTATLPDGTTSSLTRSNVAAHQTTQYTVTLQPGAAGLDTYLSKPSQTFNYGASDDLRVNSDGLVSIVQFDLSSIPGGSDIRSALLSLYHTTGGSDTVNAFRLTRTWTEGTGSGSNTGSGATWASADGVQAWGTEGGDYDTASGVATTLSANGSWSTWNLTALAAAWTTGAQPNYGVALVAAGGGTNAFTSSDTATATQRPKLVLDFLPPCGWVPP